MNPFRFLVLAAALPIAALPARAQLLGDLEADDLFGFAVATGDFNGDGRDDLAVGTQGETIGGAPTAGAVNVIYSAGAGGLATAGNQFWHQDSPSIPGEAEADDQFGYALATGDFNGDGFSDLAIGVPFEDAGLLGDAGGVHVLYGSAAGLTAAANQVWDQDAAGVEGEAEAGDQLGYALVTGDFNGDGFSDLAIGVNGEDVGSASDGGTVNVLYGSAARLTATGNQAWHQDVSGVEGDAASGDQFGWALAAGDFNGDGRSDLAVGAPGENVGSISDAGAVNVLYGSAAGLTAADDQLAHQNVPTVLDAAEAADFFGWALAAGAFNGDGRSDLAVGVPNESVSGGAVAGAANVFYGSAAGPPTNQLWHQDSPGVLDVAESSDVFTRALATGDFNGDGRGDLAVGVPFEDVEGTMDGGAVNVLYGAAGGGLNATGNQFWHQSTAGLLAEAPEAAAPAPEAAALAPEAAALAPEASAALVLLPPAPNPFHGSATLRFTLPLPGPVRLAVYDVLGREAAVLVDGVLAAGAHTATRDGTPLPSGAYLVRLQAGAQVLTQRLTLVR